MKKFEKELKTLKQFAKKLKISVRVVKQETYDGVNAIACYSLLDRKIEISPYLNKASAEGLYIFAHELGHAIEFDSFSKRRFIKSIKISRIFNDCLDRRTKVPKDVKMFIIQRETNAFIIAEGLLKYLKIKVNKSTLNRLRRLTMETYDRVLVGNFKK
jgi:hypothetical protein